MILQTESNNYFTTLEKEGQYVVDFVAQKFSKKYPHLVDTNSKTEMENWICYKSRGGLAHPSIKLLEVSNILEKLFMDLHGDNLSKQSGIMKTLSNNLIDKTKHLNCNIPSEVINCLVRTRTFIRLNNMNKMILESSYKKKNKSKLKKFMK